LQSIRSAHRFDSIEELQHIIDNGYLQTTFTCGRISTTC
jgi:hypothetical protein